MSSTYLAIMAGGIGSRFWPQSRVSKPKQFLDILNTGRTLLQMTYDRFSDIIPAENVYIVTSAEYENLVKEQLPMLSDHQILREPVRRNTAPCVAYVSDKILSRDPQAKIVVSPADHLILYPEKFREVIKSGLNFLDRHDVLLTLGIKPTRPATGYGYIQFLDGQDDETCFKVKTFTEKPTEEIARTFLRSGDFLWNSGMFIWKASTIMHAIRHHLPEIADAFSDGHAYYYSDRENAFITRAYSECTNISIDYGVMEKADNVYTIPANFGWSDIGTWDSLYEVYEKDYLGNAVSGRDVKIYDASNNMIMVPDGKLVVLQGLSGYCVIDNGQVLLICERAKEQEIKQITVDLKVAGLDKYL